MLNTVFQIIKRIFSIGALSAFRPTSLFEIIIIAVCIYYIMSWIKNTRAWALFKGIIVVVVFIILAYLLQLNTILWIFNKIFNVLIICIVVIFQPELRRALEQLGRRGFVVKLFSPADVEAGEKRVSDRTIAEVVKAAYEMSKAKTGALIVIEQSVQLNEYERTGISLDSVVSSQLLINIFEHNTPLHDGAVFVRNNRIVAATCYLPLSDNMQLSKDMGTRHRAAVGISEVSDSQTIIVSEETGAVSLAQDGKIFRNLNANELKALLGTHREEEKTSTLDKLKGILKNEKKAAE